MADYKKISIYDKHLKSPFINELLEIEVNSRKRILGSRNPNYIIDSESGEVNGVTALAVYEKVDRERFTKIYNKGITQLFNLSKSGIKVFGYITKIVKPHQGEIIFEMEDCMEYTGYKTPKAIMKGLSELLENDFIARTKYHYKYFINPTMFFNGNRVAFIKVYEQVEKEDQKKID